MTKNVENFFQYFWLLVSGIYSYDRQSLGKPFIKNCNSIIFNEYLN